MSTLQMGQGLLIKQIENNIDKMNQMELIRLLGVTLDRISELDPNMASRVLLKYLQAKG